MRIWDFLELYAGTQWSGEIRPSALVHPFFSTPSPSRKGSELTAQGIFLVLGTEAWSRTCSEPSSGFACVFGPADFSNHGDRHAIAGPCKEQSTVGSPCCLDPREVLNCSLCSQPLGPCTCFFSGRGTFLLGCILYVIQLSYFLNLIFI